MNDHQRDIESRGEGESGSERGRRMAMAMVVAVVMVVTMMMTVVMLLRVVRRHAFDSCSPARMLEHFRVGGNARHGRAAEEFGMVRRNNVTSPNMVRPFGPS
ncbi:MAG TPA: hypothetical protein VK337_20660 [Xanthobacteraceae bacterium]|nr:hypothetical protein [Xanthobacteraceae bacterium]